MAQPFRSKTGIFQLRRKVPAELWPALGREYKRSLKTRDAAEAKRLFAEEWARSEAAFALARAQLEGVAVLGERDMQVLAGRWLRTSQEAMEASGNFTDYLVPGKVTASGMGDHWHEAPPEWQTLREAVEENPEWEVSERVMGFARAALTANGLPAPVDPAQRSRLVEVFREHALRLSDLAWERHRGNWHAQAVVLDSVPLSVEPTPRKPAAKGRTLTSVFESYAEDKVLNDGDTRSVRKTVAAYRAIVEQFTELFGDLGVQEIDREKVREYRAALALLPREGAGIRALSAREAIAKAEAEGLPRLTAPTVRNKLRALSAVLSHAVRMGHLGENPVIAGGVSRAAAKAASKAATRGEKRREYTRSELAQIFRSPVFSQKGWVPPRADFGAAWYWLPLLMYYTGARREELAQLRVADVKATEDAPAVAYLSILETEDEDDGRGVKTAGSRRAIPLHSDLMNRGFLDYVKSVPTDGPLFPKLKANPAGFYGANFGKRWAAYLRDVVGLQSPASPAHGFRHAFKTLCREVGIPEDVHDAITGHAGTGGVARSYGRMPISRMAVELQRYPVIEALS
ncbi:site-specific integrase [Pseudacidovorax intermedius]|uniref:site-specific integrase n=1 Tax=Pseudacidovorax intermedius TaxID=433924 RepID=UPI0026EA66BB|nr:site-specific integrase [Pseudacidovorax intermedius]